MKPLSNDTEIVMEEPAAQEILLRIFTEKNSLIERGTRPQRVVLSMRNYREVQRFHATLGELPNPDIDYVTRYTIFELPVFIDEAAYIRVE